MSATLRHDIPLLLAEEIGQHTLALNVLGAYEIDRWGGHLRGYNTVMTFPIKLPKFIEEGYELLGVVTMLSRASAMNQSGPAWTLAKKLTVSFGLPFNEFLGQPCSDEQAFLKCIDDEPGELSTWSAYSDWLVEHNDPRGTVIAEWLDPKKAVKTKYGIPVSVRHKLK